MGMAFSDMGYHFYPYCGHFHNSTPQTQRLPAIETGASFLMSIVVIAVLPALLRSLCLGVIQ